MPTEEKNDVIKDLNERFTRAKGVVLADYQGITAPALGQLRVHMRDHSVDFLVIKNTLARLASKNTSFDVFGITWDSSNGGNNGHMAPFDWNGTA